ncbi:MAG TPA: hypothetical protein PLH46_04815 [Caldisericia bacterium]|jgi:hypothetical protein|nr:hypothetical protein [Caldisericia bacterium]
MVKESIKQIVLKEMRNPEIYINEVLPYVESRIPYIFGVVCEKNWSINQWQPDETFGDQIGQKTVLISVRMFDLWETAVIDTLAKHLERFGVKVESSHDAVGDLIIFFPNGDKMIWEIKTSQGENSFTGATHSSSKCNNYILINYSIDRDMKLSLKKNKNFIKDIAVFVWDDMEAKWSGEPSKNNSFTTLKIPSEILEKRPEIIVVGKLESKKKWCTFIREPSANYH